MFALEIICAKGRVKFRARISKVIDAVNVAPLLSFSRGLLKLQSLAKL